MSSSSSSCSSSSLSLSLSSSSSSSSLSSSSSSPSIVPSSYYCASVSPPLPHQWPPDFIHDPRSYDPMHRKYDSIRGLTFDWTHVLPTEANEAYSVYKALCLNDIVLCSLVPINIILQRDTLRRVTLFERVWCDNHFQNIPGDARHHILLRADYDLPPHPPYRLNAYRRGQCLARCYYRDRSSPVPRPNHCSKQYDNIGHSGLEVEVAYDALVLYQPALTYLVYQFTHALSPSLFMLSIIFFRFFTIHTIRSR